MPAQDVAWSQDMASTVLHALNMMYVTRRDTSAGREFSLTASGYRALGRDPPRFVSVSSALRSIFRRTGGMPDDTF